MIAKPIHVCALENYSVWLKYDDGTEGVVHLSHLIDKPVFKKWNETGFFENVHIDIKTNAIAWDENIELCPDNMYLKIKGLTFDQWKNNQFLYATSK